VILAAQREIQIARDQRAGVLGDPTDGSRSARALQHASAHVGDLKKRERVHD
jgi:hypothetical protein